MRKILLEAESIFLGGAVIHNEIVHGELLSELAAAIPKAYKLSGPPEIEINEIAFVLRD